MNHPNHTTLNNIQNSLKGIDCLLKPKEINRQGKSLGLFGQNNQIYQNSFISKIKPEFCLKNLGIDHSLNYLPQKDQISLAETTDSLSRSNYSSGTERVLKNIWEDSPNKKVAKPYKNNKKQLLFTPPNKEDDEALKQSFYFGQMNTRSKPYFMEFPSKLGNSSSSLKGSRAQPFYLEHEQPKHAPSGQDYVEEKINPSESVNLILKCFKQPKKKRGLVTNFAKGYFDYGLNLSSAQILCYDKAVDQISKFLLKDSTGAY